MAAITSYICSAGTVQEKSRRWRTLESQQKKNMINWQKFLKRQKFFLFGAQILPIGIDSKITLKSASKLNAI